MRVLLTVLCLLCCSMVCYSQSKSMTNDDFNKAPAKKIEPEKSEPPSADASGIARLDSTQGNESGNPYVLTGQFISKDGKKIIIKRFNNNVLFAATRGDDRLSCFIPTNRIDNLCTVARDNLNGNCKKFQEGDILKQDFLLACRDDGEKGIFIWFRDNKDHKIEILMNLDGLKEFIKLLEHSR